MLDSLTLLFLILWFHIYEKIIKIKKKPLQIVLLLYKTNLFLLLNIEINVKYENIILNYKGYK